MPSNSLQRRLTLWLLLPLSGIVVVNLGLAAQSARDTADAVTQRMLAASARAIAEGTGVEQGVVDARIPPVALEMFSTGDGDRVYYRVQGADSRLLTGYPDLPLPPAPEALRLLQPDFYAASYLGRPLRLVAFLHPLIGAGAASPVLVLVGVTGGSHDAMVRDLMLGALGQQGLLLAVAALLSAVGLRRALRPVLALRGAVLGLSPGDPQPLPVMEAPTELRPLVEALNTAMQRVRLQMAAQRRFVANAAHQLKTPLALLTTQAGVARSARDAGDRHEALMALQRTTKQTARLIGQMLTLSRAETGARRPRTDRIDLAAEARQVLHDFIDPALVRGVDLDAEVRVSGGSATVTGDGTMLREMIVNLVDNAVRYTPEGHPVRLELARLEGGIRLRVIDGGPGIPLDERGPALERFYRIMGTPGEGSGLGLAIVKEVAEAHGGSLRLAGNPAGSGLMAEVLLPAATS